jgi:N6-adenosine-specific RNA methylase IME4
MTNGLIKVTGFDLQRTGLVPTQDVTPEQCLAAARALHFVDGCVDWAAGDLLLLTEKVYGGTYDQVMEALGFAYQRCNAAKWTAKRFEFIRRRTNLPFSMHYTVASLPRRQQDQLLDRAEENKWTRGKLRAEVRRLKKEREAALAGPIPAGQYRVLYADPPWEYADELVDGYGAAEHHYLTMSADELCALPVSGSAAADAVLFLWATVPVLPDALRVVGAWGFEYKTLFIWDKVRHNYGHYNSVRAELLLVCTRGSCLPDSKELHDSVVCIERSENHSEKPEEFRRLIDGLYTWGPRLELFATKQSKGWETWGSQAAPKTTPRITGPDSRSP